MNKILKRALLSIGGIAFVLLAFALFYMFKAQSEMKKMHAIPTSEVVNGVFAIDESFVNMYLIQDGDQYIAFDAGNNPEKIKEELKKLAIKPEQVKAIFLTHTDGDHSNGISVFKNANVYFSEKDEVLLTGEQKRFMFFGNQLAIDDYKLLKDGQEIQMGNINIKCILTTGHTPGSMCYLVNDTYLFTGDLISLNAGKVAPFNEFFNMDTETSVNSQKYIKSLPNCQYIFTAHYGYTDDYQSAF